VFNPDHRIEDSSIVILLSFYAASQLADDFSDLIKASNNSLPLLYSGKYYLDRQKSIKLCFYLANLLAIVAQGVIARAKFTFAIAFPQTGER
jgi:hypothetical protein